MKYSVDPWMFEKNEHACFGIIVAKDLKNSDSTEEDAARLARAEQQLVDNYAVEDLKKAPAFTVYREALRNVEINPNKYPHSVEAMCKRILKGKSLPAINALVDSCNAIAVQEIVSLGGHDLREIHDDLCVRQSREGDRYLPFGATEYEDVPAGEVVFTSGGLIQTRQWLWRQSEIGKMTLETGTVFFQLVGFKGEQYARLTRALDTLEDLIQNRFQGSSERFLVEKDRQSIDFQI